MQQPTTMSHKMGITSKSGVPPLLARKGLMLPREDVLDVPRPSASTVHAMKAGKSMRPPMPAPRRQSGVHAPRGSKSLGLRRPNDVDTDDELSPSRRKQPSQFKPSMIMAGKTAALRQNDVDTDDELSPSRRKQPSRSKPSMMMAGKSAALRQRDVDTDDELSPARRKQPSRSKPSMMMAGKSAAFRQNTVDTDDELSPLRRKQLPRSRPSMMMAGKSAALISGGDSLRSRGTPRNLQLSMKGLMSAPSSSTDAG
jgi:hypothetical protein